MTAQPVPMDYASPRPATPPGRGQLLVPAAVAVAVGFLGANAFADAAGFPMPQDANRDAGYVMLRVLCGVVVFVVTFVVVAFAFRELRGVAHTLARAGARPAPPFAMALLICGTACVIAALAVQVYWMHNPSVSVGPGPRFSVQTPLMAHLLTILAFLLGVGLISIGVWSSMGRQLGHTPTPPPPVG